MDKEEEEFKIEPNVKNLGAPLKPYFTVEEMPFLAIFEEKAQIILLPKLDC